MVIGRKQVHNAIGFWNSNEIIASVFQWYVKQPQVNLKCCIIHLPMCRYLVFSSNDIFIATFKYSGGRFSLSQ